MSNDDDISSDDDVPEYEESDFDVPPDTTARDALVTAIESRTTMTLPLKKDLLQRLRDVIFDEDFAPPAPTAASAASAADASDDAVVSRGFVITLRSSFPASKIDSLQAGAVSGFLLKIHERLSTTYGDERPKFFTKRSFPFTDLDALVVKAKEKAKATLETDAAKKDKGPVGYKEAAPVAASYTKANAAAGACPRCTHSFIVKSPGYAAALSVNDAITKAHEKAMGEWEKRKAKNEKTSKPCRML